MAGPGPVCVRCHDDVWRLSDRHWCGDCEVNLGPLYDRLTALADDLAAIGDNFHNLNKGKSEYLYGRATSYQIAAARIRLELDR